MDDYYITKRQVREERKLLAEEGNEAMGEILDLVFDDSEFNNLDRTNGLIL